MSQILNFTRAFAKNFLPFGAEGVDIDIKSMGNVIMVTGTNYDAQQDGKDSSNGSGKSSLPEIIYYALYGKCIKDGGKPTHSDVMHNQATKGMVVGCEVNGYRITRKREPGASLTVEQFIDGEWDDQTRSTMTETQKMITEEIIGLTSESFCTLFIVNDSNSACFLEADGPTKKQIIENVSGLEVYRALNECAKKIKRDLNNDIKTHARDVEHHAVQKNNALQRLNYNVTQEEIWKSQKRADIQLTEDKVLKLKNSGNDYQKELDKYRAEKERVIELQANIDNLDKRKDSLSISINKAQEMMDDFSKKNQEKSELVTKCMMFAAQIKGKLSNKKEQMESIQSNDKSCPTCERAFDEESLRQVVEKITADIKDCEDKIAEIEKRKAEFNDESKSLVALHTQTKNTYDNIQKTVVSIENDIANAKRELERVLNLEEPKPRTESDIELKMLESRLEEMKKELNGSSPYYAILSNCAKELAEAEERETEFRTILEQAEESMPDIEFWIKAFAPDGIRKLILEDMLPTLNSKAAYWLDILTGGAYSIKFDESIEPIIEKKPAIAKNLKYGLISGGQKRNINLSISQALSYVTAANKGILPGLVFLDEVSLNLDPISVRGVYAMIQELSKHKKVFVTTHDQELQALLEGCDRIHFEHRDGITTIKNG